MYRISHTQKCPYCGELAPYGDERLVWISAHLDSRVHRWWWVLKKIVLDIWQGIYRVCRMFLKVMGYE